MAAIDSKIATSQSKVLALHGYRTSRKWMLKRLSNVYNKSQLKNFIAPNGSYWIESEHSLGKDGENQLEELYGWWPCLDIKKLFEPNEYDPDCVAKSLETIRSASATHSDIESIYAFSQGTVMALILITKYRDWFPNLKRVVLNSALDVQDEKYHIEERSIDLECLFVIGEGDDLVPAAKSEVVKRYFQEDKIKTLYHAAGHVIPSNSTAKSGIRSFLKLTHGT